MAEFARRCRDVVVRSSSALTEGSVRLGQWMDWGNDYFTFSDTNIEYIWRFLREMYERGYLYKGHRSTEWCPRCGTSISQHELTQSGVYQERTRPVPLRTLPAARPARASRSSSGRRRRGRCPRTSRQPSSPRRTTASARPGSGSRSRAIRTTRSFGRSWARSSSGSGTEGRSTTSGPGREVEHRVIPWDDVSLDEGTGIVHIAPGAGQEDFELGRIHDLPVLVAGRRGRALLRRVRLAPRPVDDGVRGPDRRPTRRDGLPRSRPGSTSTAIRTAGAATRRSSGG